MTYLLTEVALGILGYNFYDIDGIPGSPCLSEGVNMPLEEVEYKSRPNLTELMQEDYEKSITKQKIFCNVNGNVVELKCPPNAQQSSTSAQPEANKSAETVLNNKDKKMQKLFNFGRAKLRQQIRRHKSEYIFKPRPLEKDFSKVISSFIKEERDKLQKELEVIVNFRRATENAVRPLDKELFNKYTSTFQISHNQKVATTTLAPDDLSTDK